MASSLDAAPARACMPKLNSGWKWSRRGMERGHTQISHRAACEPLLVSELWVRTHGAWPFFFSLFRVLVFLRTIFWLPFCNCCFYPFVILSFRLLRLLRLFLTTVSHFRCSTAFSVFIPFCPFFLFFFSFSTFVFLVFLARTINVHVVLSFDGQRKKIKKNSVRKYSINLSCIFHLSFVCRGLPRFSADIFVWSFFPTPSQSSVLVTPRHTWYAKLNRRDALSNRVDKGVQVRSIFEYYSTFVKHCVQ